MPLATARAGPVDANRRETVLTSATIRAAEHLDISNATLGAIIGVSQPTVSRMKTGSYRLSEGSKPFEMAQLFLRMFRSLASIVGSDDVAAQSWLTTENTALHGRPIDLIQTVTGLVSTASYLDSRRAIV